MGAIRILLRKAAQQLGLFDMPVQVDGYTRDDGVYVAPHTARRRKRMGGDEKAGPSGRGKESPLEIGDAVEFADANGGTVRAKVVSTADPVAVVLSVIDAPEGSRWKPGARAAKQRASLKRIDKEAGTESAAPAGEKIVEHVTGRGKTLRGVVRVGITAEQAKAVDPYTFRKDGGWFIREKHLAGGVPGAEAKKPAKTAAPDARRVRPRHRPRSRAQAHAHGAGDAGDGAPHPGRRPDGGRRRPRGRAHQAGGQPRRAARAAQA